MPSRRTSAAYAGTARVLFSAALFLSLPSIAQADSLADATAGNRALDTGSYNQAITLYTRALKAGDLPPEHQATAYLNRGLAHFKKNDYQAAVADFAQALRLRPDDEDARQYLAIAEREQAAIGSAQGRTSKKPPAARAESRSAPPVALMADCKAVPSGKRVDRLDTSLMHTTFMSTLFESALRGGPEAGAGRETGDEWAARLRSLTAPPMAERTVRPHPPHQRPLCRTFAADRDAVVLAVIGVMRGLPYPLDEADHRTGVFSTGFIDGRSDTGLWMDRYKIAVEDLGNGSVGVRVTRQVFVSRVQDLYIQGISDGQNETWVLNKIADSIK